MGACGDVLAHVLGDHQAGTEDEEAVVRGEAAPDIVEAGALRRLVNVAGQESLDEHGYLAVGAAGCSDFLQERVRNREVASSGCEAPDLKDASVGDRVDVV